MAIKTNNKDYSIQQQLNELFEFLKKELWNDKTLIARFLSELKSSLHFGPHSRMQEVNFSFDYKNKRLLFERSKLGLSVFLLEWNPNLHKNNSFLKRFLSEKVEFDYNNYSDEEKKELEKAFVLFMKKTILPKLIKNYSEQLLENTLDDTRMKYELESLCFYRKAENYPITVLEAFIRGFLIRMLYSGIPKYLECYNEEDSLVKSILNRPITASELSRALSSPSSHRLVKRLAKADGLDGAVFEELIKNVEDYTKELFASYNDKGSLSLKLSTDRLVTLVTVLSDLSRDYGITKYGAMDYKTVKKLCLDKAIELLKKTDSAVDNTSKKGIMMDTIGLLQEHLVDSGLTLVKQPVSRLTTALGDFDLQTPPYNTHQLITTVNSACLIEFSVDNPTNPTELFVGGVPFGYAFYRNDELYWGNNSKLFITKENYAQTKEWLARINPLSNERETLKFFDSLNVLDESIIVTNTSWDHEPLKEFVFVIKEKGTE